MPDDDALPEPDDDRVQGRAELLPEEEAVGSDDPVEQARVILEESDERSNDPDAAPSTYVEHRRSEDTVAPPD